MALHWRFGAKFSMKAVSNCATSGCLPGGRGNVLPPHGCAEVVVAAQAPGSRGAAQARRFPGSMFCPHCANLLVVEPHGGAMRFACKVRQSAPCGVSSAARGR